jgi:glycosyltransferase involved in cell wall biosynthesis
MNWCLGGYHEAAGGRPPGENRLTWRPSRALTLGLERFAYRPPRTRIAEVETPAAKATVERLYPGLQVVHIPLVYDTERFRPDPETREQVRAELGAGADEVVALYVGRNPHVKGLDLGVEGLADARRRGAGVTLWAAGTADRSRVMRLASRHGVEEHVKLVGFRQDVERFMAAADVFLLPTIYEHGSRSSHEAAACGLPLLVTATHGPAALIGDDEGGIVIERDAASIGSGLARLAGDPELRRRMGSVARERMLARIGHSYEPYFELYEQLAAGTA